MAGSRILILEDDLTLGEGLKKALIRAGHEAHLTDRAEEAKKIIAEKNIQVLFIDCLLPGQSGVDFTESIRGSHPADQLAVVLMSGIFTDASFVKDSLRSTQAIGFLKKPFDVKEAINLIPQEKLRVREEISPRKTLYQSFNRGKLSVREKRKMIESLDEIHGYDLPFIYSLLVDSKVSGHLNIAASNGDVSGISFSKGLIVGVDIADHETYLGKLLIESGYILSEDLEQILNVKSGKRIGERLIQGNLLSPHAFNVVLSNQMNIRLSRTIVNLPVKINFGDTDIDPTTPNIDSDALVRFLHDWIAGKISLSWLKTHYMQWGNCVLQPGPTHSEDNPALKMPIVASLPDIMKSLTVGETVNQIVDAQKYPEEPLYKAIHFLLTKGLLILSDSTKALSTQDLEKIFKKLSAQMSSKNKLEIFDLMTQMTNLSGSDPAKVYSEFMALLGQADTAELQAIKAPIEKKAKEAYEFAKSGDREKLRQEMEKAEVELKLAAAAQFEEGKNLLQKAQYSQAYTSLTKALAVDSQLNRSKIFLAWAKLGMIEIGALPRTKSKEVEIDLVQVSPEDKFDALYVFVMGMYQRCVGDIPGARKSFEKALAMDAGMIVARRELNRIVAAQSQNKDVLNRDLKDIVSGFFGKKK
jgi:CheY-like chemotaxis protein